MLKTKSPLTLLLAVLFCCAAAAPEKGGRILSEAESPDGRVRASLSVSPLQPQLSDTIFLTLEIDADATLQIEKPAFGSELGDLRILDISEPLPTVSDHRESQRLVLKVVPKQGGTTPIWPIPIRYTDRREDLRGNAQLIVLPASQLEIAAHVTPETASLEKIASPYEIFDIASRQYYLMLLGVMLFVALIALTIFLLRHRKPKESDPEIYMTPLEIALRRLAALVENRLHETDVKQFFMELTGIVRWYIEQQTGIRAPERTTEEFLHEMMNKKHFAVELTPELRDRLRLFLESADMVKFAKFEPSQDEIMLGFRRAEEFVRALTPSPSRLAATSQTCERPL